MPSAHAEPAPHLIPQADAAKSAGSLSEGAHANLVALLRQPLEPWEQRSLAELLESGAWDELNDRFFKALSFGTGGLRGRTIGKLVTAAERGDAPADARPQCPAVGSTCVNYRNIRAATEAFIRFLRDKYAGESLRLAVSCDSRFFSREFAREVADTAATAGVDVLVFAAPASTPQLAFAIREHECHAGVMITASHNPPHDNGYKVYLRDSSQVIEPDASRIAAQMTAAASSPDAARRGQIKELTEAEDERYLDALGDVVIDHAVISRTANVLKLVYSQLHGTGGRIIPVALERLSVTPIVVREQADLDGAFPTVKSPNPENAEAFTLALALATRERATAAIATDPDADRIGIAARRASGNDFALLTGNQVAALLAEYRLSRFFSTGVLTASNKAHAVIVKTFVTTDLLHEIARAYGVRSIDTLTGFKYIGAKLRHYAAMVHGPQNEWLPVSRQTALERGVFMVLGCEESYGYLCGDYVRDKDANGAALMVTEALAAATDAHTDILEQLDNIYLKHGFFGDRLGTIVFEGSKGAAQIARLLESYRTTPPARLGNESVSSTQDFERSEIKDSDGQIIPHELMLRFHLQHGGHVTVRGSGTEPKIKFYLALKRKVEDRARLEETKASVDAALTALWNTVREDAITRAG